MCIFCRPWWKRYFYWAKSTDENTTQERDHGVEGAVEEYRRKSSSCSTQIMIDSVDVDVKDDMSDDDKSADSFVHPSLSRKWPTPWYWQLAVLIIRTFRQSRHVILSKLNMLQTVLIAIIASMLWFQIPDDEESIGDRYGYVCAEYFSKYVECSPSLNILFLNADLLYYYFLDFPACHIVYLVM